MRAKDGSGCALGDTSMVEVKNRSFTERLEEEPSIAVRQSHSAQKVSQSELRKKLEWPSRNTTFAPVQRVQNKVIT